MRLFVTNFIILLIMKNKNSNQYLIIAGIGALAIWIGYKFKEREKQIQSAAVEIALGEVKDTLKSQVSVTKDYFNSLTNYWKQVWKN